MEHGREVSGEGEELVHWKDGESVLWETGVGLGSEEVVEGVESPDVRSCLPPLVTTLQAEPGRDRPRSNRVGGGERVRDWTTRDDPKLLTRESPSFPPRERTFRYLFPLR